MSLQRQKRDPLSCTRRLYGALKTDCPHHPLSILIIPFTSEHNHSFGILTVFRQALTESGIARATSDVSESISHPSPIPPPPSLDIRKSTTNLPQQVSSTRLRDCERALACRALAQLPPRIRRPLQHRQPAVELARGSGGTRRGPL